MDYLSWFLWVRNSELEFWPSVAHELLVKWGWFGGHPEGGFLSSAGLGRLDEREPDIFLHLDVDSPCRLSSMNFLHVGSGLPRYVSHEKAPEKGYLIFYYPSLEAMQQHI